MNVSKKDKLDINKTDIVVSITKGMLGIAPFIGPTMAELFGHVVPNQRLDRFADVLKKTIEKVDNIELLIERIKTQEGIEFTEETAIQAGRALSEDRRIYIANLYRNSLTKEEQSFDQKKKLFYLLNQLNDHEIILLKLYSLRLAIGEKPPFVHKHWDIIRPPSRATGASEEDRTKATFRDSYIRTLDSLGIVKMQTREFSNAEPVDVTPLRTLLLDYIEVPED
jgi:hypothetical protein